MLVVGIASPQWPLWPLLLAAPAEAGPLTPRRPPGAAMAMPPPAAAATADENFAGMASRGAPPTATGALLRLVSAARGCPATAGCRTIRIFTLA